MNNLNHSNNKRIVHNTILLYFRMLFIMMISLYTSREVLKILGVEDFGIYNVVAGIVLMLGFLNNAMTAAVQRYTSFELGRGETSKLHMVFCMSVTIHIVLSCIVFLLAETIGLYILLEYLQIPSERMFAAIVVYHCALFSFVVNILQVPYMACIISHEKMGVYAIGTIADSCAKLFGIILLSYIQGDKLIYYGIILLIVSLFVSFYYRLYCISNFAECKFVRIWDKTLFREMFSYSSWSLFGGMASVVPLQGVNILLNMFFGPAINAARAIAYQVNTAVSSLYSSFTQAVNPQIVKQYSAGNIEYMHQLIFRSCKFTFLLVLLLACPILLETRMILQFWLGTVPEYAVSFCRLVLITTMIDSISMPLVPAVNATGKIRNYQIIVGATLLMNLPLSYIALEITGIPEYCFVVGIFMAVIVVGIRLWICHRLLSISIRFFCIYVIFRILLTSLVALIPFFAKSLFGISPFQWGTNIVVGLLFVISSIWFIGINSIERRFVYQSMLSLKKRLCSSF